MRSPLDLRIAYASGDVARETSPRPSRRTRGEVTSPGSGRRRRTRWGWFSGDGFGTLFGHSSWSRHPGTERARRAPVPASSAPSGSTVDECRHLGPVVPDVPGPHPVEMAGVAHGIDHRLVHRVDVGEHRLEALAVSR